jgi:membrane protease YdiL (CAAX protease family)
MEGIKMLTNQKIEGPWVIIGLGYTFLFLVIAGYYNFTQPYDPNSVVDPSLIQIILWSLLYIPLCIFAIFARWEIKELGFSINPSFILASLLFTLLCASFIVTMTTTWLGGLSEAYARTGEELFFRGFLFLLLLKILGKRRSAWVWAAIGSSLAFALVHTQTFQGAFLNEYSVMPVVYRIMERIFNLFLIGFSLALLRFWTKSILPGSIAHAMLQGGIVTLPFVILIHAVILFWAYRRNEGIISGFDLKSKLTTP